MELYALLAIILYKSHFNFWVKTNNFFLIHNQCHFVETLSLQFCLPSISHKAILEKNFNQIDEDKCSQHYATLNRGRREGVSTACVTGYSCTNIVFSALHHSSAVLDSCYLNHSREIMNCFSYRHLSIPSK